MLEKQGPMAKEQGVSLWGDENVVKSIVVKGSQFCEGTKTIKLYTLNE